MNASQRLDARIRLRQDKRGEGLDAFIRRMTPHRKPPRHVARIVDLFGRALTGRETVKAVISMPPGHAKTITACNGLVWWLTRSPADTHAYGTYSDSQAHEKSVPMRNLARAAGITLSEDTNAKGLWRTSYGGGLIAGGRGSGFTGKRVTGVCVIDDPFKDRNEANSQLVRDEVWSWYTDVMRTRLEGASELVIATRWHQDDLIGRLIASDDGWEVINLPALAEENDPIGREPGEALWPELFPVEKLESIRRTVGEFTWAALFQGRPVPRGSKLFGIEHYYDPNQPRPDGFRLTLAADPAASIKTSADYSAAIVTADWGFGDKRVAHVLRVYREQVSVPQFARDLRALQQEFGGIEINVESVGAFKAIPQLLLEINPELRIKEIQPLGDKFTRAQGVAAAWNQARVLVPLGNPPWLAPFLAEVTDFTGVGDRHDDQVDALSSAWNSGDSLAVWDVL